ncbi:hypothetical protein T459_17058 [Capsicum annuum]|uniref:Uncharacterized protein n=1 Tax=Capsicum annuum TaxID=4072 RepID=A0A2G2ZAG9_CAPAN|nr:hypothetical protein T459_17058 [Capsicum annuum]
MNDRFTDVLKSLQLKNETVKKENVTKEIHKEGHQSDDVADFEGNSDPVSLNFVMEKTHKMENLDVIMYYLRKKYKNKNFSSKRYTTTDCFFKAYIDKAYLNYYDADTSKDLATQNASAKTDEVADIEMALINTIKGFSSPASQP